jgi:cell division GTPase FtsZ
MDLSRIMTSGSCTIYGKVEIPLYVENGQVQMTEDDVADLLIKNLQEGLLVEGFDVSEAVRAGIYITGKSQYLSQIPASTFNFAFASLNEQLKSADLFRGVYADERLEDKLTIYTLISGIGLPRERVEELKEQAMQDVEELESKEKNAKARMEVFHKTIQSDQDKYAQRKKQSSAFGKMVQRRKGRN